MDCKKTTKDRTREIEMIKQKTFIQMLVKIVLEELQNDEKEIKKQNEP